MFGSLAWGGGAFIAGWLIDTYGMNALFYYSYFFNITSTFFVIFGLPSTRHVQHSSTVLHENVIENMNESNDDDDSSGSGNDSNRNIDINNSSSKDSDYDISDDSIDIEENSGLLKTSAERGSERGSGHRSVNIESRRELSRGASREVSRQPSRETSRERRELREARDLRETRSLLDNSETLDLRSRSRSTDRLSTHTPQQSHVQLYGHKRTFFHYIRELYYYFSNAPCRAILVNAFLYGIVMTVPDTFLFVSLEKDYKASRTFSGMITTTSIFSCLPLFWYSSIMITRYGHYNLLFLSQITCIVRLFAYSLLSPSWSLSLYVLPYIQLLHGLNFALYWSSAIDAIHKLSPKELQTICIAALNITFYTCGGAVGNIMWGYIYDNMGGIGSVYWYSSFMLLFTVMLLNLQKNMLNAVLSTHVNFMTGK